MRVKRRRYASAYITAADLAQSLTSRAQPNARYEPGIGDTTPHGGRMTRSLVLGVLLSAGTLTIGMAAQQAQPRVIEVEKLKDNLYVLKGGGGNTAVFIMTNGVAVVDAKNPGWGQPILDKIKTLTDKPVTTLINTHTHGDHVSGNVEFPASVDIVVQENTAANMKKMI